jgi:HSP20 family protein
MALVKYNPAFPNLASSLFADFFSEFPVVRNHVAPKVDVAETDNGYEVQVALPGFKKEDIKIDLEENRLTISGERKWENKDDNKRYHFVETEYGSFSRTFSLPKNVKADYIEASYKEGILNLVIPKAEKEVKKFQISVN